MTLLLENEDFSSSYIRYLIRHITLHPEDNCTSKQTLWENLAYAVCSNRNAASTLQRECKLLEEHDLISYAISQFGKKSSRLKKSNSLIKPPTTQSEVKSIKDEKCKPRPQDSNEDQQGTVQKTRHENVLICVLDDARKTEETFVCPRSLLLREMPYFEKFLESETEDVEVQFSVHCDIQVFKRLLLYASKDPEEKHTFQIEPKYAVHMLVSAEFLEMEPLVEECLKYCYENVTLLLSMSGIIGLLSDNLLERLADLFSDKEVDSLQDPGDKIKSKFFWKKAENLINSKSPRIIKCSLCHKVFSQEMEDFEPCIPTRSAIGSCGEMKYEHKMDPSWDRTAYLQSQYEKLGSWASIYWRIWGCLHSLPCLQCGQSFPCYKLNRCRYHPEPVKYPDADGKTTNTHLPGKFLCCGLKTFRFNIVDPLHLKDGCAYRAHVVPESSRQGEVYKTLMSYKDQICLSEAESPVPPAPPPVQFELLCTWAQDRISKPTYKALSAGLRGTSGSQKTIPVPDINKNRLLPGRRDSLPSASPQPDSYVTKTDPPPKTEMFFSKLPLECPVWNPSSSVWHNQDTVREYDYRAMDAIIAQLKQL